MQRQDQKLKILDQVRDTMRLHHYSIHTIQALLGHSDVATTMIYTHILQQGGQGVPSPLDDLDISKGHEK